MVSSLSLRCDYDIKRNTNAAQQLVRGFNKRGLGQSEDTVAVETTLGLCTSSGASDAVDQNRVVETGDSTLTAIASAVG